MGPVFTFNLTGDIARQLLELARKWGVTPEAALARALANESFLAEKTATGSSVLVQKPDRSLEKVGL